MPIPAPAEHSPGAVGRHGFHQLRILRTVRETEDASSFVLDVPPDLRDAFAYQAGQFCTFRVPIDGRPVFRCYSMSSSPDVDDELQVTVKRVPDGAVSNWMNDALAAGDTIDVSPPAGTFHLPSGEGDVVAFGGGSGITPMLSILKSGLATTSRHFRLLYANRDPDSVIFRDAIDELAQRYPDRLTVIHHFDVDVGFVEPDTVRPLVGDAAGTDFLICGPTPFMDIVEQTLLGEGVAERCIHIERFTPSEPTLPAEPLEAEPATSSVTIELDGRVDTVEHHPGTTILQVARQLGMSPPFSCESGSCATCMAMLVEGTVTMRVNDVLDDDEVADGWVLTCQAVPTAPSVRVVYGYEED
jgi:3-ketosteroid 9alpha-monooxygenase subunit B